MRAVLEGLLNHNYTDTLENIYVNAQTQMLLLYSLDCMLGEKEIDTISCKFLANEPDREKIIKAREILIQHIGEPITIKELSRKVAINECYLKKGFKEMFGTTVFEFYQSQRMEHAKYLLYEKGLSVTDVSAMLGYSSISHFSTAFKKHTGLKAVRIVVAVIWRSNFLKCFKEPHDFEKLEPQCRCCNTNFFKPVLPSLQTCFAHLILHLPLFSLCLL